MLSNTDQTVLAIRSRKKSVLSNPDWKTIPWEQHAKTQKDKLLDILIEIPTLLEESDILSRFDDETQEEKDRWRERLIDHCWRCDEQLTNWHDTMTAYKDIAPSAGFQTKHRNQAFSATLDEDLQPINNNAREKSMLVDTMDLGSVHLMTLYWSTCVLLYSVLRRTVNPDTHLPERVNDIKTYCRKIIRAIPIFFHPAVGAFRAYLSTFPMYVVILHLYVFREEEKKVELKLLEDCYDTPEGMTVGRFMKSVELEANAS